MRKLQGGIFKAIYKEVTEKADPGSSQLSTVGGQKTTDMKRNKFGLDIGENFFIMGKVKHRSRLPRKAVQSLSLEAFKTQVVLKKNPEQPGLTLLGAGG